MLWIESQRGESRGDARLASVCYEEAGRRLRTIGKDLVKGKYVVQITSGAVIAVKITDMLGEEVLVISSDGPA